MFKFAFFVNSQTLTPENYYKSLEGTDFYGVVCGVNSMKMACETAKKLSEEGIQEIDLCGDFNLDDAKKIKDYCGGKIEVWHEIYSSEEEDKLKALKDTNPWGIIIEVGRTWSKDRYSILKSEECDTYIACVNGMDDAIRAAEQMVRDGVKFVELCSYYDEQKAQQIIEGIGGAIPVGYPAEA